ncbi:MAG: DMT family transporter [Anaerolineae bacterium]|nr:DMT family transporter [Anaerolineae bacterium]
MEFTGYIAAVLAALAFSVTSTFLTLAGRHFRPSLVMQGALPVGLICIFALHWLATGQSFPPDVGGQRWLLLSLSGILGFWLSSIAIVNAMMRLGPRLALLITATSPILSTIMAWIFLEEVLNLQAVTGITFTLAGIAWVVSEKGEYQGAAIQSAGLRQGVLFALAGALGQSASFLLSKEGLSGDFDPLSASLLRIVAGTVAIWLFALLRGRAGHDLGMLRAYPTAFRQLSLGAIAGPVAGASLMLLALQNAPVGIATTLGNLTPIFLIPIGYIVFKERITNRAIIGTLMAVVGMAVLFL